MQGKVLDIAKEMAIKKLVRSTDHTDKRLIKMIKVHHALDYGFKIGLKGFRNETIEDSNAENIDHN